MRRIFAAALLLGFVWTPSASALELSNVRITGGPLAAKRTETKFLPGDLLYFAFDIKDIQVDKSGWVIYQTIMEILDKAGKEVFKQETPPQKVLLLGGKQLPASAFTVLGTDRAAGKYKVKITVKDGLGKQEKSFTTDFEILPKAFGIVQPATPAVSFSGLDFVVGFSLAGMKPGKDKLPDVTVTLQLFDEKGADVFIKPVSFNVQLLHDPPVSDLTTKEIIPVSFPLFLNRPGRYTIQIDAYDEVSKEKKQLKLPLKVLDPGEFIGN